MLKKLTVSNLAVVEKVEVEFAPGLNVLTGETGAGKSVIMGALELILGARADASVVREGAKEAEVEVELGGRVFRRTLTAEGRSRAWIDDESVTLAELKAATAELVDVHGARANQRLLEESFQRECVDAFAGAAGERARAAYASAYGEYASLRAERDSLTAGEVSEDELDLLRFQVGELDSAAVTAEDDDIAERHAAAAHAEELVEAANGVCEALGGEGGAESLIDRVRPELERMTRHLAVAADWSERIGGIADSLNGLSREIADTVAKLEVDPDDFAALDERLTCLSRLKRKYLREDASSPFSRLSEVLAAKRGRLSELEGREERLVELDRRIAAALEAVTETGASLTRTRQAAAKRLVKAMTAELGELGLASASFDVRLGRAEPAAAGLDAVDFEFAPNPGEGARSLKAIASSGEIARVMLALKTVSRTRADRTLVFDEIDANLGGEIALAVGRKLRSAAEGGQVVAITHLPQSAVWGERHFVVEKRVEGGRTRTGIFEVSGERRVAEIARMLGGEKITSVARKHAQELLGIPT